MELVGMYTLYEIFTQSPIPRHICWPWKYNKIPISNVEYCNAFPAVENV